MFIAEIYQSNSSLLHFLLLFSNNWLKSQEMILLYIMRTISRKKASFSTKHNSR